MIAKRGNYGLYAVIFVLLLALVLPGLVLPVLSNRATSPLVWHLLPILMLSMHTILCRQPFHSGIIQPGQHPWTIPGNLVMVQRPQNKIPSTRISVKDLYTVKLTVTNVYGSSTEIKENYIAIGLAPKADFSGTPTTGNTPLTVEFTDRSTGYPTSWKWNFGDGKESSDQNPVHTFWSSGEFTVTLTASNEYGTSDVYKSILHSCDTSAQSQIYR